MSDNAKRPKSKTTREFLVVLAIVGGLGALAGLILPVGPVGRNVPAEEPIESRRVHSTLGISIVLPVNWQTQHIGDDIWPRFQLWPMGPPRRRASIVVARLPDTPNLDGFSKITFRGEDAFEKVTVIREWTLDDPAQSKYELCFQANEQWYQVTYGVPEKLTELPKSVRRYVETLRIER